MAVATLSSLSRFIVLAFARLLNYGFLLLSPIVFVRILDVHSYGQYREFAVYALVLATILGFSIKGSLLYFIPKEPENEHTYVTQAALFVFLTSTIGLWLIYLLRDVALARTSFDFLGPLIAYVFFFVNMDFVESYWLAKKRSDYVLYYITVKTAIKLTASITAAYLTRDVVMIVLAMTAVEGLRFLIIVAWSLYRRLLVWKFDTKLLMAHLSVVLPFGAANVLNSLNQQLGKLFVSIALGPSALAIYTIGAYQVPIIGIVRTAAVDVLFPEMVQRGRRDPLAGLKLWQKANVLYLFAVFPCFILLFYYAETFITTLFTVQYQDAVSTFRILMLLMLRQCFEFSTPIRAMNANKVFIWGNSLGIVVSVLVLFSLYPVAAVYAAPIALIMSELCVMTYMATRVLRIYDLSIQNLMLWRRLTLVSLAALSGVIILVLGELTTLGPIGKAAVFSVFYLCFYLCFVRIAKIPEVELVVARFSEKVRVLLRFGRART